MRLKKLSLGVKSYIAVAVAGLSIILTRKTSRYLRWDKVPRLDVEWLLAKWFICSLVVLFTVVLTGLFLTLFNVNKMADKNLSKGEFQEEFAKLLITIAMTYISMCILYLYFILVGIRF